MSRKAQKQGKRILIWLLMAALLLPQGLLYADDGSGGGNDSNEPFTDHFNGDLSDWDIGDGGWAVDTVLEDGIGLLVGPHWQEKYAFVKDRRYENVEVSTRLKVTNNRQSGIMIESDGDAPRNGIRIGFSPAWDEVHMCLLENNNCDKVSLVSEFDQYYDLKVTIAGQKANVYVDNVKIWSKDDFSFTGGKVGVWTEHTTGYFDSFSAMAIVPDATPPTAPGNVQAAGVTDESVTLTWEASTDNEGVAGYEVYSGDLLAAELGNVLTYTLTGLAQNTPYLLSIRAVDLSGNKSDPVEPLSASTRATQAGDTITHNGIEYAAKYVVNWNFNSDGQPWGRTEPTWDGHNAVWEDNPFNGDNKAISLAADQNGERKSHVGSIGLTAAQLQEISGKENYLVRLQLRRWQEGGWGDGGSFLYWSIEPDQGDILWKDNRDLTKSGSEKNGQAENFFIPGTSDLFATGNAHLPKELRFEWRLANWSQSKPVGSKLYVDDISVVVYVDPQGERPAAPAAATVHSDNNTFGWSNTPGYNDAEDYEYSIDNGSTWTRASSNPQPVGDRYIYPGHAQVRVSAEASINGLAGYALVSDKAFVRQVEDRVAPGEEAAEALWLLGKEDNSGAEFKTYGSGNEVFAVPADWATRTAWMSLSQGMKGDQNGELELRFELDEVPEHGARFSFHILDAYKSIPQMAVFSNDIFTGMIQIAGIHGSGAVLAGGEQAAFKELYQLYIPQELLKAGANTLTLKVDRGLYADTSGDPYLWYKWDYLKLEALTEAAVEPLHGRYIHMGTNMSDLFTTGDNQTRNLPQLTEWLGIAYSGNWIRVPFWSDIRSGWEAGGKQFLETLRELNLAPMLDLFGGDIKGNTELQQGNITEDIRNLYRNSVLEFGDLFQYLEVQNEPGLFGWHQQTILALTQMLNQERAVYQPHLEIIAPGWAYWPSNGAPDGWERDPAMRRPIEELSDMTNGHSYGGTGVSQSRGGSLIETLLAYPEGNGSIPKEMVISETGANDYHVDNTQYGTYNMRYASAFDREMRANIGYADHIMQHAAFFHEGTSVYSLFDHRIDWNTHRPEDTLAWPNDNEEGETRLKTFRRLSAAYATHGTPLTFEYSNAEELEGKQVLFRGVDTSGLGNSAVGASSDKIVLSFVSFETEPVTVKVNVTMPSAGEYTGSVYGAGEAYADAYAEAGILAADPELELEVTLQPGETVQYYLNKAEAEAPAAPTGLQLADTQYDRVTLNWQPSTDNAKVKGYHIYRNGEHINTVPATLTRYQDYAVEPLTEYEYEVKAFDASGNVSASSAAATTETPAVPVTPGGPKYEAEHAELAPGLQIYNDSQASNGQGVGQTQNGALTLMNIDAGEGGAYVLTIRYASGESGRKGIVVNGTHAGSVNTLSTGGWSGSDTYADRKITVMLRPGANTISIVPEAGAADIDYIHLEPGEYVPTPIWHSIAFDNAAIEYSGGFEDRDSHYSASTVGAAAEFAFRGTGFSWRSSVKSDLGTAQVYVDRELVGTVDLRTAALEGDDKEVFKLEGLEDGLHVVRIQAVSGTVPVYGFRIFAIDASTPVLGPDMIVTDISWDPAFPKPGERLLLSATIKNVGVKPTPQGVVTGGAFTINGGVVAWTDVYKESIAPGESVTLIATGGPGGSPEWLIPQEGSYTAGFMVNDIFRFAEMDGSNNLLEEPLEVSATEPQEPTPTPTSTPTPTTPSTASPTEAVDGTTIKPKTSPVPGGGFKASVTSEEVRKSLQNLQAAQRTVAIQLEDVQGSAVLELPVDGLFKNAPALLDGIIIRTPMGQLRIKPDALDVSAVPENAVIALSIKAVDNEELAATTGERFANAVIIDLELTAGGERIHQFNGRDAVVVSLPYELAPGQDPDAIVVYYLDSKNGPVIIPNGRYEASSGQVIFRTNHFSQFGAAANAIAFSDITKYGWARDSIAGLAAREVVQGIGGGKFAPERQVTRAEFLHMLMNALQLESDDRSEVAYSDVDVEQWYYLSIAVASKLGIVTGYADGSFAPDRPISREEMAVMTLRAAQAAGVALDADGASGAYSDSDSISGFARDAVAQMTKSGLLNGKGNAMFAPKHHASRAESAKLIYSLLLLDI